MTAMSLDLQSRFADALADPNLPVPDDVVAWNDSHPQRRFAVYRNNVAAGLTGALASLFPAAVKIVGEAFFEAMAQEFVRRHPPRSPLLLAYGHDMPDFVAGFSPAASLPYLPDVMRIETARSRAYHAADIVPLDPAELAKLDPLELAAIRLRPHPSMTIVRSAQPAVTIWSMNAGEAPLSPVADWTAEDALVTRPTMLVEVRRLPPGGATFLSGLANGLPLAGAADAALDETATFDLVANLAGMLQAGAFTTIRTPTGA